MSNAHAFLYDLPTDRVTGTWSQTGGTVNPLYPLTRLDDGKPWNPTVFTVNPSRISIDHGSAVALALVSFVHCNFPVGYAPVVSRGSTLGTPLTTVTMMCLGPTEDNQPSNPFVDMSVLAGVGSYRYTWIDLPVTGTLLSFGLIRLTGTRRQPAIGAQWGGKFPEKQPVIERPTDAGVQLGYSRGTRARWVSGHIQTTDAGFAELLSSFRSCLGRFRPFLLIYDPASTDPMFKDARWVKWGAGAEAIFTRDVTFLDLNDLELDWEELGRGLAP